MSRNTAIPSANEIRTKTITVLRRRPCLWQIEVCQAILRGDKDVISIAATGAGKTLTFWMPLLFRENGIQIVITPLNVLGTQNMRQLEEIGISSIAIRAETALPQNFKDIEDGKYRVVILNPNEAMRDGGGFENIWKNEVFTSRIISVIWDEGHCISIWKDFRAEYREAGRLRYQIPKTIPYLVPSATLPDHIRHDVMTTLHMQREKTHIIRCSNDRPNVYLTVRRITHSLDSFEDLAFLIPQGWKPGDRLRKFLVFFDDIKDSIKAANYLRSRLPLGEREKVIWFNSDMSSQFRDETAAEFKSNNLYGLYCTDSFGMGVDVADIEIVVQWRVTCDFNTLWQRFGRAARSLQSTAVAILLAESKYFDPDDVKQTEGDTAGGETGNRQKRKAPTVTSSNRPAKKARVEGSARDAVAVTTSTSSVMSDQPSTLHEDLRQAYKDAVPKEGARGGTVKIAERKKLPPELDDFVNAPTRAFKCYRTPVMAYYANDTIRSAHEKCRPELLDGCVRCAVLPSTVCCELCHPEYFDEHGLFPPPCPPKTSAPRASRVEKKYHMVERERDLRRALNHYRRANAAKERGDSYARHMGPGSTMGNDVLQRIVDCARAYKIRSIEDLRRETKWNRATDCGQDVLDLIAQYIPIPTPTDAARSDAARSTNQAPHSTTQDGTKRHVTCSRCGGQGHIRSNRRCPMFDLPKENIPVIAPSGSSSSAIKEPVVVHAGDGASATPSTSSLNASVQQTHSVLSNASLVAHLPAASVLTSRTTSWLDSDSMWNPLPARTFYAQLRSSQRAHNTSDPTDDMSR